MSDKISFNYRGTKIGDSIVLRPVIPITLDYKGNILQTEGIIDSGSDITMVTRTLAEGLGIDIKGSQNEVGGITGKIKTIFDVINMRINESFNLPATKIFIPSENDEDIDQVILGRNPLFEKFDIIFEERFKRVTLRKISVR